MTNSVSLSSKSSEAAPPSFPKQHWKAIAILVTALALTLVGSLSYFNGINYSFGLTKTAVGYLTLCVGILAVSDILFLLIDYKRKLNESSLPTGENRNPPESPVDNNKRGCCTTPA